MKLKNCSILFSSLH